MTYSPQVGAIGLVSNSPVPLHAASPEAAFSEAPAAPSATQWVCVHHRAGLGAQVRFALRSEGIDVHWPREVVRRPRHDDILQPLFPGYLFAVPAGRRGWGAITSTANVLGVLGVREFGRPTPVPRGFVEALIQRAGAIDLPIDETPEGRALMKPGQVVINGGGFDQVRAILLADRGAPRVRVLLNMLGSAREVDVPREQVREA